jgi:hypothetical protein
MKERTRVLGNYRDGQEHWLVTRTTNPELGFEVDVTSVRFQDGHTVNMSLGRVLKEPPLLKMLGYPRHADILKEFRENLRRARAGHR